MWVTRRDSFSAAPVATAGGVSPSSARRAKTAAAGVENSFDQITLSAGQSASPSFRSLAANLSQQVRTYNTTGKIQDLRNQVASGTYRPDARETAARMLLLSEDE